VESKDKVHKGEITYSMLDTILQRLIERSRQSVCLGGEIHLTIVIDPADQAKVDGVEREFKRVDQQLQQQLKAKMRPPKELYDLREQLRVRLERENEALQVIVQDPKYSSLKVRSDFHEVCGSAKLIYFPVFLQWCPHLPGATEICPDAHSMAVLIDTGAKTIEYYESNGSGASWYPAVSRTLTRLFADFTEVNGLRVRETGACPRVGLQGVSGKAICAYFASLYVALRISCPQIAPDVLVVALLTLEAKEINDVLQHWHCWLIQFAETEGIAAAAEDLSRLHSALFLKLINLRQYLPPGEQGTSQERTYWAKLREAEEMARYDIVQAYLLLNTLDRQASQVEATARRR
jgi:hypothetical protein